MTLMILLIADSGSTKTDWSLVNDGKVTKSFQTEGLNPYHHNEEEINSILSILPEKVEELVPQKIYYYGAGCGVLDKQEIIKSSLQKLFSNADILVESDLLGACHGLLGHEQGIVSILGTGSNSCSFDGERVVQNVSAGGYILGDEGSGAVLGRLLASDYIKNQLPETLKIEFEKKFELTPTLILEKVYREPKANRFLAQLTPFLLEHIQEPVIYNMVFNAFDAFVHRNIMQYPNHDSLPLVFTGSIAHYFHDVLEVVLYEYGLRIALLRKTPMEGLIDYYTK